MVRVEDLESTSFVFYLTCCGSSGNTCMLLMPKVADIPWILTAGIIVLLDLPLPRAREPTFSSRSLVFDIKGTDVAAVADKALNHDDSIFQCSSEFMDSSSLTSPALFLQPTPANPGC